MSYRSIKRVFGESNLERKILILVCICLFLLIGSSFFLVNRNTENLIKSNTVEVAENTYNAYLLDVHLKKQSFGPDFDPVVWERFSDSIYGNSYRAQIVTLRNEVPRKLTSPSIAIDPAVIYRLRNLEPSAMDRQRRLASEIERLLAAEIERPEPVPENPNDKGSDESGRPNSLSYYDGGQYIFLKPIEFQRACVDCHSVGGQANDDEMARLMDTDLELGKQKRQRDNAEAPVLYAKITMPYATTRKAIARSRAILTTFAIVTAFMSVLALYAIVRYVISKPLRHLRDVTEEVSHGRTDVRSTLNTGDEFEELSRSLNRMLRHLLDTQIALSSANADLDRKVDEQAQLTLHLHEVNQIKSEFLANMSHELRTPLNSIIGFSEVLDEVESLNDKQKRYVSNIRKSGRLLLELINDILDLAKLEAGKMEATPSEFSLAQLTSSLCDMVRPLAERKNIQLALKAHPDGPNVFQDQMKIRQILTNLLSNAIKFTPEGGRIRVEILPVVDQRVTIKVIDTGVGIADADREVIFEKFRQGPTAIGDNTLTREFSGTGLGLSIVKELCILLGGTIELESEIGKGSIFTVTVPMSLKPVPRTRSEIAQTIDEITKGSRIDFARTRNAPQPPAIEPTTGDPSGSATPAVADVDRPSIGNGLNTSVAGKPIEH